MDFLTRQEVAGMKQDAQRGNAMQDTEKMIFSDRLLNGLGEEMMEEVNNPTSKAAARKQNLARKLNRKKRRAIWRENFARIFGTKKETV